jgi:hypothetical protein
VIVPASRAPVVKARPLFPEEKQLLALQEKEAAVATSIKAVKADIATVEGALKQKTQAETVRVFLFNSGGLFYLLQLFIVFYFILFLFLLFLLIH